MKYTWIIGIWLTVTPDSANAQWVDNFIEFFTIHLNKGAVCQDSTRYLAKIIMTPIVAFSPETNIEFGGGARYLLGLGFLIDKGEDLNLRFDYGFGSNTQNYYLQVAESF